MKYIPLSLLLFFVLSCVEPGGKISFNNNKEVIRSLFEAYNNHDWATVAGCYADSTLFLDASLGDSAIYQTQEATIKRYQALHQKYPDMKAEIKDIYSDGNHVIVEFVAVGTARNSQMKLAQCAVFTLKDGKIVENNTYFERK
ncbi:nuclear transport factor 2 family protein [Chitinophaga silvatica]|nr:nuclear transport factor 2 family protein [Chitinophaga silvatica]